ncbi:MAG: hypothetical protein R2706_06530 [Acidimicrobiales bacterium]
MIPTDDQLPDDHRSPDLRAVADTEEHAELRYQIREAGRRRGGTGGAMVMGIMLALKDIYEATPFDEQAEVVVDAEDQLPDVETHGVRFLLDENEVTSQPPPRPGDPPSVTDDERAN